MKKAELLQRCKELGIKGVASKTKGELEALLDARDNRTVEEPSEEPTEPPQNTPFGDVLLELLLTTPKDKHYKVCKNCHEIGHDSKNVKCRFNMERNDRLTQKIKQFLLSQNCLSDKSVDDYCDELSRLLNITPNVCKTLCNAIPAEELIDREMDIGGYINMITENADTCSECDKELICIQTNTHRVWKYAILCDVCWGYYENERNEAWRLIKAYKDVICVICQTQQLHSAQRFHYDHLNMFYKGDSVCSMVNNGSPIEDIYKEIDKCQVLCVQCHHIVTDIERRLNFIRIKQTMTRQLNTEEITLEEYDQMSVRYQDIYENKMKTIYEVLRNIFENAKK
jgi:transcription elongation factor Elf1